ncbi:MAG: hypothetical protein TECD_00106 [Hyphomicrobiaceae bacterium hypho_1]
MVELLQFVSYLITLYLYVIVASVVLSWLVTFNVVNPRNDFVRSLGSAFYAITEPLLRPIRSLLPNLGGIDLSPVVLGLGCMFVQTVILPNIAKQFI